MYNKSYSTVTVYGTSTLLETGVLYCPSLNGVFVIQHYSMYYKNMHTVRSKDSFGRLGVGNTTADSDEGIHRSWDGAATDTETCDVAT